MHLTIPIETAPTVLYTSIHTTHYRTTGQPVLEYYVDNTRHQTTVLYTSIHATYYRTTGLVRWTKYTTS
jgi:Na+/pantothenate symporter